MSTNASPYVVNIVDLQNIATGIAGTSQNSLLTQAQTDIANIQEMVNFETKTISADIITSFTQGKKIDVLANLNLSNASLYSNSNLVSLNTNGVSISSVNTLGGTNTQLAIDNLANTITFTTAGTQSFQMNSSRVASFSSDVYVGGTLFVTGLVHSSDKHLKTDITSFSTSVNDVLKIESHRFKWLETGNSEIGFIAQEIQTIWPELVEVAPNGSIGLAYSRFIPLLLESIRELNSRVSYLESLQNLEKIDELDTLLGKLENHLRDN